MRKLISKCNHRVFEKIYKKKFIVVSINVYSIAYCPLITLKTTRNILLAIIAALCALSRGLMLNYARVLLSVEINGRHAAVGNRVVGRT